MVGSYSRPTSGLENKPTDVIIIVEAVRELSAELIAELSKSALSSWQFTRPLAALFYLHVTMTTRASSARGGSRSRSSIPTPGIVHQADPTPLRLNRDRVPTDTGRNVRRGDADSAIIIKGRQLGTAAPCWARYAKVCTMTGPAIAVAGPTRSGVRLCSIHARTRLFDSSAPA
jgi:hypothetical protein